MFFLPGRSAAELDSGATGGGLARAARPAAVEGECQTGVRALRCPDVGG